MAVAADWIDRALAGVGAEALSAAALVPIKPRVPTFYPPIRGAADLVKVGVEPMGFTPLPGEAQPTFDPLDPEGVNRSRQAVTDEVWALRQQLEAAVSWGGVEEFAALVMLGGVPTTVRLTGSEAAIRQALPDADTVKAWREAGVMEFPMQLEPGDGAMRRITWVPIDQVPVILQMERAWRGALADA